MERIPDDPLQRELWLQRWADEQAERLGPRDQPLTRRMRAGAAKKIKRLVKSVEAWAERRFDRDLHTGEMVLDDPEHAVSNRVAYVASEWHVLPRALWYLRAGRQDVFCDFGCGKGTEAMELAQRGALRVYGVDIVDRLLVIAREQEAKAGCHNVVFGEPPSHLWVVFVPWRTSFAPRQTHGQ